MKRGVVVVGLIAGVSGWSGCTRILGIDPAVQSDDDPGVDPDWPRIRLTAQIAQTSPADGSPDPTLAYAALAPAPAVQVGRLDGPLMNATYEADGADPGRVAFPPEYLGMSWRLAYTLDDGVPREVHWAPAATLAGHLVQPLLGRLARAPVPATSGYTISPPNLNPGFQHTASRLFTTGIWTEGSVAFPPAGRTLDYVFSASARSLGGPLGAPESAMHDYGILADFKTMNGCRFASGTAAFQVPNMIAGSLAAPSPQPTYLSADRQVQLNLPNTPGPIHARIQLLLGSRASPTGADAVRWEYGYAPSLGVPAFSKPAGTAVGDFLLPGPRMIAFVDCAYLQPSPILMSPAYADSIDLRDRQFPRVVHVEVVNSRTVSNAVLSSGFAGVVTATGDVFTSDFTVAAATRMTLRRDGNLIADLADGPDSVLIPLGADPLELRFVADPENASLTADYFDITLYAIANGKLDRLRVYTVTAPSLAFDPSVLAQGTEYVFEIRAYRGRPDAARADFRASTYPQYAATIFTRSFRTP